MLYTRPVKAPTLDVRHHKTQQAMPQKPQSVAALDKGLHLPAKPTVKPPQIGVVGLFDFHRSFMSERIIRD